MYASSDDQQRAPEPALPAQQRVPREARAGEHQRDDEQDRRCARADLQHRRVARAAAAPSAPAPRPARGEGWWRRRPAARRDSSAGRSPRSGCWRSAGTCRRRRSRSAAREQARPTLGGHQHDERNAEPPRPLFWQPRESNRPSGRLASVSKQAKIHDRLSTGPFRRTNPHEAEQPIGAGAGGAAAGGTCIAAGSVRCTGHRTYRRRRRKLHAGRGVGRRERGALTRHTSDVAGLAGTVARCVATKVVDTQSRSGSPRGPSTPRRRAAPTVHSCVVGLQFGAAAVQSALLAHVVRQAFRSALHFRPNGQALDTAAARTRPARRTFVPASPYCPCSSAPRNSTVDAREDAVCCRA